MTENYLLDTCVLSEVVSKKPDTDVLSWLGAQIEETLFLSVITIGEIQKGITKLPASKRKANLERWLKKDLLLRFDTRILPFDTNLLIEWGKITATLAKQGRILPVIDSFLVATSHYHNLIIVTRNVDNFKGTNINILNIWEKAGQ